MYLYLDTFHVISCIQMCTPLPILSTRVSDNDLSQPQLVYYYSPHHS